MIRYVILACGFLLFLAAIGAISKEHLNTKAKTLIVFLVLMLLGFGYIFEAKSETKALLRQELLLGFEQNKTLKCKQYSIDNKKFNYEYGTASFVAKDSKNGGDATLAGLIISVDDCELIDAK